MKFKNKGIKGAIKLLPSKIHPYKSIRSIYDQENVRHRKKRKNRSKLSRNKFTSLLHKSFDNTMNQSEHEKTNLEILSESKTTKVTKLPQIHQNHTKDEIKLEDYHDYPLDSIEKAKKLKDSDRSASQIESIHIKISQTRMHRSVEPERKNMAKSTDISTNSDIQPIMKRIHRPKGPTQGVDMFKALIEKKTSTFQLQILRNRILRLQMEERRAQNQIETAKKRCERLEKLQEYKLEKQRLKDESLLKSRQKLEYQK